MVRALAGAGAHVILNGRDDAALAGQEADLKQLGLSVERAAFDVTDISAVRGFFSGLKRLDIPGQQCRGHASENPSPCWSRRISRQPMQGRHHGL